MNIKILSMVALAAATSLFMVGCQEDDEPTPEKQEEKPKDEVEIIVDTEIEGDDILLSETQAPDFTAIFGKLINPFIKNEELDNETVDLGLPSGTRWASKNVGASSPWDLGDLYAWADPNLYYTVDKSGTKTYKKGKTGFNDESYKYYKNGHYIKYKISTYGDDDPYSPDNLHTILAADDPANVNMGDGWFTPTISEVDELHDLCKWEWTNNYNGKGVAGMVVTGPNGNSIFLPHTSMRGNNVYYMSSSVRECPNIQNYDAHSLCFSQTDPNPDYDFYFRVYGSLVRAIRPEISTKQVAEAVDLGLPSGIRWASHNIGTDNPARSGDFVAWGETTPYYDLRKSGKGHRVWRPGLENGYVEENYRWNKTKYPSETLQNDDDAANAYWGGKWRTPTEADFKELQNECQWEWKTEYNGVQTKGFLVTGPNGNSIFLPTTSYMSGATESSCLANTSLYWTRTPGYAFYWYANDSSKDRFFVTIGGYGGCTIRPVLDK